MYDTPGPGFPNTFQTKFSKKYGTREFIAAGIRNAHRRPEIFTSNQTEHRLPLRNRRESYIERGNKRARKWFELWSSFIQGNCQFYFLSYRDNIFLAQFSFLLFFFSIRSIKETLLKKKKKKEKIYASEVSTFSSSLQFGYSEHVI